MSPLVINDFCAGQNFKRSIINILTPNIFSPQANLNVIYNDMTNNINNNTIAEYEKPVIIVQNMIDSIKPSLDGKKSVADVAQELRVRVERIINRSNIKDKSKVHIVQISAINALKARQNGLKTNEDRDILEASNYKKLVADTSESFSCQHWLS